MDALPTLETVQRALHAVYSPQPDTNARQQADKYLTELRKSVYAWEIADKLLLAHIDEPSCIFAAQMMRAKIQDSFQELPETSHVSLRDSLLAHCTKINALTSRAIVTQLCLAMSDLLLIMSSWKNAVQELLQKYGSHAQNVQFLLEVLTVLPEEFGSEKLRLGSNRRTELLAEMILASPLVEQFLTAVLNSAADDVRTHGQVLICFGNWIDDDFVPQPVILQSKIFVDMFQTLRNKDCPEKLHDDAAECVCLILSFTEELDQELEKNATFCKMVHENVLSLVEPYKLAVALCNKNKIGNFVQVFTELAESFLESMIKTPGYNLGDFAPIQLLFTCMEYRDYEIAGITFSFWGELSEELYHTNSAKLNEVFRPCIKQLVLALCTHCRFRAEVTDLPPRGDDFEKFRADSLEIIRDMRSTLGPVEVLKQMFEIVKAPNQPWPVVESSLFVMQDMVKFVETDTTVVPELLQLALSTAANAHVCLRRSVLMLVGNLARWIAKHDSFIDSVTHFLLTNLVQPKLSLVSASGISKLCDALPTVMARHFDAMLLAEQALDSADVYERGVHDILAGLAMTLTKMTAAEAAQRFRQLCLFQVEELNKMLQTQPSSPLVRRSKKSDPAVYLDRLSVIFRNAHIEVDPNKQHPYAKTLNEEVWQVQCKLFALYASDEATMERLCRSLKYELQLADRQLIPILQPLLQQKLTEPTLKLLCGPEERTQHPDVVDDFFRLTNRFLNKLSVTFLRSEIAKPILMCAVASMSLQHKAANKSACLFVADFVANSRVEQDREDFTTRRLLIGQLLDEFGQAIVNGALQAAIDDASDETIKLNSHIIHEMIVADRVAASRWIVEGLKTLPTRLPGGTVCATEQQLANFHQTITKMEKFEDIRVAVEDFVDLYN